MQNIQEIFERIQANKKQLKDLKSAYNDALDQVMEHKEISDKIKTLRERKKQIESTIQEQFASEFIKMDDLKIDITTDQDMLTDAAVTTMMKGSTVEVKDEYNNEYEPVFKVSFKKVK